MSLAATLVPVCEMWPSEVPTKAGFLIRLIPCLLKAWKNVWKRVTDFKSGSRAAEVRSRKWISAQERFQVACSGSYMRRRRS